MANYEGTDTGELITGSYLEYSSIGQMGDDTAATLIVLAQDIDSGVVIVTAIEDVEPTTTIEDDKVDDEIVEPTP